MLQVISCSCPLRPSCCLASCWSWAGCERGGTPPAPSRVAGTAWLMAVCGDLSSCCVIPHHPGMTQDMGMLWVTDEWLVRSTCSSGSELAETFSQAVPLLQLRCAWVSACSKAAGLAEPPAPILLHCPVLQNWGLLPQACWHRSWPVLASELCMGIVRGRASLAGARHHPGDHSNQFQQLGTRAESMGGFV